MRLPIQALAQERRKKLLFFISACGGRGRRNMFVRQLALRIDARAMTGAMGSIGRHDLRRRLLYHISVEGRSRSVFYDEAVQRKSTRLRTSESDLENITELKRIAASS